MNQFLQDKYRMAGGCGEYEKSSVVDKDLETLSSLSHKIIFPSAKTDAYT